MRPAALLLLLAAAAIAQAPQATEVPKPAEVPKPKAVVPMPELMVKVIYPYADAIFYVEREAPKNEVEWNILEAKTLALAEIGNLLMSPGRAVPADQWMQDAQLLVTVATKAYNAAKKRDLKSIIALNDEAYESCQSCHVHYRPGYRRRP